MTHKPRKDEGIGTIDNECIATSNIVTDNLWALLEVDGNASIAGFNTKASGYFANIRKGAMLHEALPWFDSRWLTDSINKRIAKTTLNDRFLLQFIRKEPESRIILLDDISEYRDVMQAWCEIGRSLIELQPLIDSYDDAVMITNGEGLIRAFNRKFIELSGLTDLDIINRSVFELADLGLLPHCAVMDVVKSGREEDSLTKFSNGNEAIMSAKPLYQNGKMIRITTNTRNVNKLTQLYTELTDNRKINKQHCLGKMKLAAAMEKLNIGSYSSRAMESVFNIVETIADFDIPLLITGESGTGKTTIAKCIYLCKTNCRGDFVHINCSSIPATLIEAELFGYEKGAFTGADRVKKGLFEEAGTGVIMLDEIGDMPLQLQSKLLNVLQEKSFYRLGGTKAIRTDAQVIAATNKNLQKLVADGFFREDLYFRLNVIPIEMPALRDRREDIRLLIEQIVHEINSRYGCRKVLNEGALSALEAYDWPGNIRELRNVIERTLLLTQNSVILRKNLPADILISSQRSTHMEQAILRWSDDLLVPGRTLKNIMAEVEEKIVEQAVDLYGSVRKAAAALQVDTSTITRKRRKNRG